mmetsp:Transcript_3732/g.5783  ORF Transcript_3732/g.5783 Transcript_3732/m.5783 type:complete len:236 (+) Transcript_3732:312-1019(+)
MFASEALFCFFPVTAHQFILLRLNLLISHICFMNRLQRLQSMELIHSSHPFHILLFIRLLQVVIKLPSSVLRFPLLLHLGEHFIFLLTSGYNLCSVFVAHAVGVYQPLGPKSVLTLPFIRLLLELFPLSDFLFLCSLHSLLLMLMECRLLLLMQLMMLFKCLCDAFASQLSFIHYFFPFLQLLLFKLCVHTFLSLLHFNSVLLCELDLGLQKCLSLLSVLFHLAFPLRFALSGFQ